MTLSFDGHVTVRALFVLLLLLPGIARCMQAHIFQSCLSVLAGVPSLNFGTSQTMLRQRMLSLEPTLAVLDQAKVTKLRDEIDALVNSQEGSPVFYLRARDAIVALNNVVGKNTKQYKALEALHNNLLRLSVAAKPSIDSPEMSSFFSIRSRYLLRDPDLRRYVLLQILAERKGSQFRGPHGIVQDENLIRPSFPWDNHHDTLLVEGTQFSDEDFSIIKNHLQSQEVGEVQNARNLVDSASSEGYFSASQITDLVHLAERTKDPNLFQEVVESAKPTRELKAFLGPLAKDHGYLFWKQALKKLNKMGDKKMIADTVALVQVLSNPKISLGALSALPPPKKLTTDQLEDVQLTWLRHLSNEELPKSEVFGAVNWLEGSWGKTLKHTAIDAKIARFKTEVDSNPQLAKVAAEAGVALKNNELLDIALDAADRADSLVRAKVIDAVLYHLDRKDLSKQSLEKLKVLFEKHPKDSYIQEQLPELNFILKEHGL